MDLHRHNLGTWSAGGAPGPSPSAPPVRPDSIRAPKGGRPARIEFRPVPVTDLAPSEPPEWIWTGYAARGYMTLFTGLWKAGKSTLIGHLLRDLGRGGGLAREEPDGRPVAVVSEESEGMWSRRRDELGLGPWVHVHCRPFRGRPSQGEWRGYAEQIALAVRERGYGLVVLDTIAALWSVADENDAPSVLQALAPLHAITEAGAALLLTHHPRKGDAGEGQASRGSGALPGAVDVIVEMRRFDPASATDARRELRAYSRLEGTPPEAVLELRNGRYEHVGDRARVGQGDRLAAIASLLPGPPGLTADELHAAWTDRPRPGLRTLEIDLRGGAESGLWARSGTGHRGDPFRYSSPAAGGFDSRSPSPLGARIESVPLEGPETPEWARLAPTRGPKGGEP